MKGSVLWEQQDPAAPIKYSLLFSDSHPCSQSRMEVPNCFFFRPRSLVTGRVSSTIAVRRREPCLLLEMAEGGTTG